MPKRITGLARRKKRLETPDLMFRDFKNFVVGLNASHDNIIMLPPAYVSERLWDMKNLTIYEQ